jgi:DNA (cytosine-5)-methyltransferase 1
MNAPQMILDLNEEIIIDNFAGGGGASTGIELALGRYVDVAINHDPVALSMHAANHPQTRHYCESVWDVNPREVMPGRKIGLLWLSPDCKHFSKAKGGKPVEKKIRGLAWVALRWVAVRQPRVIMLENVEEFQTWGRLGEDGKPCPKNKGREFNAFKNALKKHGYQVEHRELRGSDYGVPTIRKRLFLIARRDGQPIVWPEPTHGDPKSKAFKEKKLKPWKTAADCIDWSVACPSIFLSPAEAKAIGVRRPLAENTERRIYRGIVRYVLNAAEPFIVPLTHQGSDRVHDINQPFKTITGAHRGELALAMPYMTEFANASNDRNMATDEPMRTQCAQVKGGHFALVNAFLAKHYTGVVGSDLGDPLGTVTSVDHHSLVSAHITKFRTGSTGHAADEPLHTVTAGGDSERPAGAAHAMGLVTSNLVKMRGTNTGQPTDEPLATISAGGTHHAEVRAFLIKYYGTDQDPRLEQPMHTIPTKDRFGLVTIQGENYQIVDIGLRMLLPRELFRAHGFSDSYIIEKGIVLDENGYFVYDQNGNLLWRTLSKSEQVRMVGNSVCPGMAAALVGLNVPEMKVRRIAA